MYGRGGPCVVPFRGISLSSLEVKRHLRTPKGVRMGKALDVSLRAIVDSLLKRGLLILG